MGKIVKVSGPLVVATGMEEANMADVVRVGEQRLIGEILNMSGGAYETFTQICCLSPASYRYNPFPCRMFFSSG